MIAHRALAALIGVWALITWGGRIGLLSGDETVLAKARIAVSLLAAAAAVIGLLMDRWWTKPTVGLYVGVTLAVWVTSIVSVVGDPAPSGAFNAVHLALAGVSIALAAGAWRVVFKRSEPEAERRSGAPTPTGR